MSPAPSRPDVGNHPGTPTEAEAFLQQRLVLLYKVMFFLAASILLTNSVAIVILYSWETAGRELARPQRFLHMGLILYAATIWLLGSRIRLRGPTLVAVDVIGIVAISAIEALMAANANTGRAGALELMLALMLVLTTRAIIIPSSGRQTLGLGIAATAVSILIFTWQAIYHPMERALPVHHQPRDQAVGMMLWAGLILITSTVASRVIYGLRREVRLARQIGQYELLEKIGEGGMGVVYRARHALLRRDTAIKLLSQARLAAGRLQRFEREVRLTARLTHPNTVAIYDYGRTPDGVFYYAMEYLDGVDLERLVMHQGPLPVARASHILRQILLSLTEAHESGLVHRDIKPANVILCERGGEADVAKVVDFGLVKDLQGSEAAGVTAAGDVAGTPLYLAPEAAQGSDEAGPAGDLYAVAAVGYFLVTGSHVFPGSTMMEICAHHLYTPPEPPSVRLGRPLPVSLELLILSGLSKRPEERPRSARAFCEALEAAEDIPGWSQSEARAWWDQHRESLDTLRRAVPMTGSGRTVAVDLRARDA